MNKLYEEKIRELLREMTLEEKIGQLQQCGPSLVGAFEVSFRELLNMRYDGRISEEEFTRLVNTAQQDFREEELRAGKIGSYTGVCDVETANRLQKIAVEETRLGIPLLFGYDVIHGFRTVTPIPLAESCAWEPELWEETARMAAKEATAGGIHMTFAPMTDVAKDARWGRISEGAGEDVYLNGMYGAAKVRGFQGNDLTKEDAMAACVKHFAGYGAVEAGMDYNRVDMSMQRLWEEYLPAYKMTLDAGARAVMPAFNDINGIPCTVNSWLLRDILREKWGFDGVTISDANAVAECVDHGIVTDRRQAAREALKAGTDVDMGSDAYSENLKELVQSGEVSIKELDEAVANMLRIKLELGLFEQPYKSCKERESREMLKEEHRQLARKAAGKSIVLLKNNLCKKEAEEKKTLLPLKKETYFGIFGELAGEREEMTGTWALAANPGDCISILDACKERGIKYQYDRTGEKIEEIAKKAEVLLAVLGERKEESGEAASKASINLPGEQISLLKKLAKTGKPVVVVLFNGRPLAIPEVDKYATAILEAWHPGVEAGNAVWDVLLGEVCPGAKLTTTFPGTTGQCPMYYAHISTGRPAGKSKFTAKYLDAGIEPLYPFGWGLSYTTFAYSDMKVTRKKDSFEIRVTVKNTGETDGEEIVQCYARLAGAKRVRPVKELKAFQKLELGRGEKREVRFEVPLENIGYYDWNMKYTAQAESIVFYTGGNSRDCLEKEMEL